jgi:hypothetical protein
MEKFMKYVGGKRGLAVLAGSVVATLAALGVISAQTAEIAGSLIGLVGGVGIVHSNIKANAGE